VHADGTPPRPFTISIKVNCCGSSHVHHACAARWRNGDARAGHCSESWFNSRSGLHGFLPGQRHGLLSKGMAHSQKVYFCSPLGDGSLRRPWQIANMSDGGARLTVADPDSMPDSFIIVLKGEPTIWRRCVVVWRSATEIGISFKDAG
jgi:hypothetical protein